MIKLINDYSKILYELNQYIKSPFYYHTIDNYNIWLTRDEHKLFLVGHIFIYDAIIIAYLSPNKYAKEEYIEEIQKYCDNPFSPFDILKFEFDFNTQGLIRTYWYKNSYITRRYHE
jgi:hypothetical protein